MIERVEAALRIWRRRMGLLLPMILFISLGCGKRTEDGQISGKVTYQGKPLSGGSIIFFDGENEEVGSATLGFEGDYSVSNVPAGLVKIAVLPPSGSPRQRQGEASRLKGKAKKPSALSYTVQPGVQEYNIDLQ